jgi:MYXO-CTERM domain-containing protein
VYDLQWNSGDGLYAAGDTRSHFATPPGGRLDVGVIKVNVPEASSAAAVTAALVALGARRRRT